MSPRQLLAQVEKRGVSPAYLFLGPEAYLRAECRRAILDRLVPQGDREGALTRHDLSEVSLVAVLDDARSYSLFTPSRLIWVAGAEIALPRGRASAEDAEENKGGAADAGGLAEYMKDPPPGVVLVFDCARYDLEGEDKAKADRVRKFYSAVSQVVEFSRPDAGEAEAVAGELARRHGLKIGATELSMLVEAAGFSAASIATEIEKLKLYAGDRAVTVDDVAALVPQAQASNIFALVRALGRKDRRGAMETLDALLRAGEYLPLALAFLATQFRQALAAREAGLRSAQQVMGFFSKQGVAMWPARAEQVVQTLNAFSEAGLREALQQIAGADLALRDIRPDDRVVLEKFVLGLTAK